MSSGRKFSYDFKYDAEKEEYIYECIDEAVQTMIPVVSKNNLLCYVIDTSKFGHVGEMKQILVGFAEKIVEFIKNADLYMDNFEYVDMDKIQLKTGEGDDDIYSA